LGSIEDAKVVAMQAPFEMTGGRKRLTAIIDAFPSNSPHWNEAQNRFQFVDRLLTECLGWEHPYIEVESTDELGGRADYLLGRPVKAVLEAKREAKLFDALPAVKPNVVRKLRPLLDTCKNLEEAILQVIPYCSIRGAQIAIVCNGPQLVIFQALVVGESPLDGECFLFNGFDAYLEHFALLWTLLSPEGIAENRPYRDLALHRNPRIPPKASLAIPEPNRYRYRSQFQENLRSLASLLLEEIEDDPALKPLFYKECYVPLAANNRHLLLSKRIISSRYQRVTGGASAPSAFDSLATVDETGGLRLDPALALISARPIVVIGDVGVGKTSFFQNLFEQLDASEKANTYFIHVNLGIKANLAHDLKTYILSEIPLVLKTKYSVNIETYDFAQSIYYTELDDFDRSVKGAMKNIDNVAYQKERIAFLSDKVNQKDRHLHAALAHLAHGRRKQIILVLDNADQRKFEIQQDAFLIAQELAATRSLLCFVALRPSTFHQSKMTGALSGYQNRILTIAPPPADEVIARRITFAVRVAEGKAAAGALEGIRLHVKSIVAFLNATLRSIRANQAIRQFLSNITGGNTRLVIELITAFCGSPNVDSEKIVSIEEKYGNYLVPLHEFTKHALLGEYAYYNALSSIVACNIFDISTPDPREYFLSSLIIAFLNSTSSVKDNDGFALGTTVLAEMMKHGFLEEQVRHHLRRLARKRLIETPYAHYREIEMEDREPPEQFHFRATSIGIYHLLYWSGSFSFVDATSTDTPIFDTVVREQVMRLAQSFDIEDRYTKTVLFCAYLQAQWQTANITAMYYDFGAIVQSQSESFEQVKAFIDRGGARQKRR
jgi:predicted type IV restriction endonuclease